VRQPADATVLALAHVQGFSDHERAMVLDFLTQCPRSTGRPWTELSARVPALAGRDFTWPEFDRWQAFFAARRRFPVRWDGLQVTPPARTPAADAYQWRKLDLLFEWLDALTRRSMILAHYARQGLETRIVAQNTGEACAGCVPFVARGVRSDQDAMPPFHPGCRCVLVAAHATRARQRTRAPRAYPHAS
jgi:hypothetical protein